jgi:hypothetical protein
VPSIDAAGRELFWKICNEFADLKLKVDDAGRKESAQVYFPCELKIKTGYDKQVATVQYMGSSSKRPFYYRTIEIRFYLNPFRKVNGDTVIEKHTAYQNIKQNGNDPYVHYNIVDATEFTNYIRPLFQELSHKFREVFGNMYDKIPRPDVPESLKELPRYIII